MTTILKGQFFKEIVATKDTVVEWGWTVLWVESGGDGSGNPTKLGVVHLCLAILLALYLRCCASPPLANARGDEWQGIHGHGIAGVG